MKTKSVSMSVRISLAFILIVLAVMIAFSYVLYDYFQVIIHDNLVEGIESTVLINSEMVDRLFARIESNCNQIHNNEMIYSSFTDMPPITKMIVEYEANKDDVDFLKLTSNYTTNLKSMNDLFFACFNDNDEYSNVLFTDSSWSIHQYMPKRTLLSGGKGFSSDIRVKDSEWYQIAVSNGGNPYWFVVEETGELCMAKAIHYTQMENGLNLVEMPLGVISVMFDSTVISEHLDLNSLTPSSAVLLFNKNEKIVYSNRYEINGVNINEILEKFDYGVSGRVSYINEDYYMYIRELPLELEILTLVPVQDIYQMSRDAINIIIIISIVMILIVVFATFFLSKMVFNPLRRFTRYIAEGHIGQPPFKYPRNDELGILFQTHNNLIQELDRSMKNQMDAIEAQKKMELRALQLQINPHFIYNALNSVSCLAMLNRQEQITDIIDSLTRVIRYNINCPDGFIQIKDEVSIIQQYERIHKSCYSQQISLEYNVSKEVESLQIPKLIIQPLIENSLKYGVMPNENIVYIKLDVHMQANHLVITVWDSGRDANIEKINQYISGKLELMVDSLGVRNVYERLEIAYRENASFVYSQDQEGHTIATIKIAAKAMKTN